MKTIANKYAGKCSTCKADVPAGKGYARKTSTKWIVLCTKDAGETHGASNPWRELHRQAEYDYCGGEYTRSMGRNLVDREFAHTDELAEPCETEGCGGTMHYRATVGAPQCPDCRAMVVYKIDQVTLETTRKIIPGNR